MDNFIDSYSLYSSSIILISILSPILTWIGNVLYIQKNTFIQHLLLSIIYLNISINLLINRYIHLSRIADNIIQTIILFTLYIFIGYIFNKIKEKYIISIINILLLLSSNLILVKLSQNNNIIKSIFNNSILSIKHNDIMHSIYIYAFTLPIILLTYYRILMISINDENLIRRKDKYLSIGILAYIIFLINYLNSILGVILTGIIIILPIYITMMYANTLPKIFIYNSLLIIFTINISSIISYKLNITFTFILALLLVGIYIIANIKYKD